MKPAPAAWQQADEQSAYICADCHALHPCLCMQEVALLLQVLARQQVVATASPVKGVGMNCPILTSYARGAKDGSLLPSSQWDLQMRTTALPS